MSCDLILHILLTKPSSLPKIQSEVTRQLDVCNKELQLLPPPITADPASYVLTLVTGFCQDVARYVHGGEVQASELVQANRRTYAEYKREIRSTAPAFMPFPTQDEVGSSVGVAKYLRVEDDEDDEDTQEILPAANERQYLYLEDVRRHVQLSLARELPNNVPYASKVTLIEAFQRMWPTKTENCFTAVYRAFDKVLTSLSEQRFGRYSRLRSQITCVHSQMRFSFLNVEIDVDKLLASYFASNKILPWQV